MYVFLSLLLFIFMSVAALSQGTMSTDDSDVSRSAASLSGTNDQNLDASEEEFQRQEEELQPQELDEDAEESLEADELNLEESDY